MEREFLAVALIFPLPTESPTSSPISWFPLIWRDDTDLAAFQDLREAPSNGRNCCQFLVVFYFMGLWYRGLVRQTRVFIRKIFTSIKSLPRYRRNVKSNQNQAFRIVQDWVLLCTGLYLEFMAFLLWHCVSLIPQLTHWEPKCATVISHWGVCQPHLLYVWNIGPFLPPVWCLSQPLRKTKPNMWIKHNAIMGGFSKTER